MHGISIVASLRDILGPKRPLKPVSLSDAPFGMSNPCASTPFEGQDVLSCPTNIRMLYRPLVQDDTYVRTAINWVRCQFIWKNFVVFSDGPVEILIMWARWFFPLGKPVMWNSRGSSCASTAGWALRVVTITKDKLAYGNIDGWLHGSREEVTANVDTIGGEYLKLQNELHVGFGGTRLHL
jgi:hypothetical protein